MKFVYVICVKFADFDESSFLFLHIRSNKEYLISDMLYLCYDARVNNLSSRKSSLPVMECIPLSALRRGYRNQCIHVRASRVWHYRGGLDTGEVKAIRMVLIDERVRSYVLAICNLTWQMYGWPESMSFTIYVM
jgi:hypothetical protein